MFSVYKHRDALAHVIAAWETADDTLRDRLQAALLELEKELQTDPGDQGESREGATRVVFRYPVAVAYEIDEARRLVRILRAWPFRRVAA